MALRLNLIFKATIVNPTSLHKKRGFPKTTFKPCDLPLSKVSKARQDFATPPKGLHESVYVV